MLLQEENCYDYRVPFKSYVYLDFIFNFFMHIFHVCIDACSKMQNFVLKMLHF
jgi:hypothetical protein